MQHYTNFEASHRLGQGTHPVQSPLPGQVRNNASGFSWQTDDMTRLYRFLILGSMGGTYYVGERDLLQQNVTTIMNLLKAGKGMMVVDACVDVSTKGRAPSNDPALLILAMCASCDLHGTVRRLVPAERTYMLHRAHHESLFQKYAEEFVPNRIEHKNGHVETFLRIGDVIYRTIKIPDGTFVEEGHPDDLALRQYALSMLPRVARTGTHLFHFIQFVRKFRGWGPMLRRAVQHWYLDMPEKHMARLVLKYQSRDGYSQRDILRLSHPKAETKTYNDIFHWVTKGWPGVGDAPHPDLALQTIWAFERAKRVTDEREMAALIREYRLSRESVPSHFLTSPIVYEALLHATPAEGMESMIRNLGNMSRIGLLAPGNKHTRYVTRMLTDPESVRKSRLHPLKILSALTQYALGHGDSGGYKGKTQQTWQPVPEIVTALDKAFRLAFANVPSTGKKILLALDVSGSMSMSRCNGLKHLTLHQASGAMAVMLTGIESVENVTTIAVDTDIYPLVVTPDMPLPLMVSMLKNFGGGGTNLSLVIEHARRKQMHVDCFVVLTDGETWQGKHPAVVLEDYRREINAEARVINIQMTATSVTNNAPDDRRALEVAGFDTSVPEIIHRFLTGDI